MREDPRQFRFDTEPALTLPSFAALRAARDRCRHSATLDGSVAPAGFSPVAPAGAPLSGCLTDVQPSASMPEATETTAGTMTPAAAPPAIDGLVSERPTAGGDLSHQLSLIRARQLELGHTPAADDAQDIFEMSKRAGRLLARMNESASLHRLDATQRDALKLAAYAQAIAESCHRRLAALADQTAPGGTG